MGKVLGFFDELIDLFTGWNSRHKRALREISDLSHAIEEFVVTYKRPSDVFENIGQARIDVTTITCQCPECGGKRNRYILPYSKAK